VIVDGDAGRSADTVTLTRIHRRNTVLLDGIHRILIHETLPLDTGCVNNWTGGTSLDQQVLIEADSRGR
jgi:hypothetical protein